MPAIINGYTLIEPPYQGGMAMVYKGEKGAFSRAFKMVRPDKANNNPRLCERFLNEIKLQTKLEHPNIIKILDAYPFTDPSGRTFTVLEMEWLNGMDLQRFIENKSPKGLDSETLLLIANGVIDGMEYAHNKGILHLDIKPSNIFRTFDGYIKIIDFGIARVVGENAEIVEGAAIHTVTNETGESTFKGTLAYASPEQQVGGKLSLSSDIYSFGKTLHFLATGTTDPSVEVKDRLLSDVISKCTVQNPKHRYQNFGEIRNALKSTNTIKCEKCGNEIQNSSKFCPNCGTPVGTKKVEKCPKCGKERIQNAKFCDACGWNFENKSIRGYRCAKCGKITRQYSNQVNFCNHCGASKQHLSPVYQ